MSVILLVLPLAVVMAGLGVWAFMRSVREGQYDDLDTPALRILSDDTPVRGAGGGGGGGGAARAPGGVNADGAGAGEA
jgi:cbb3-type cytochrome oxidase maturation protein